jgi:hypothetical protein
MVFIKSTAFLTVTFAILFFLVVILLPGENVEPLYAGAAAGIFSIFTGFSISSASSRLGRINELLKSENAHNLVTYYMVGQFGKKTQDQMRAMIDNYLMSQIDNRLEDFDRSSQEFKMIREYVMNLEFSTPKQEKAYAEMVQNLNKQTLNRSQIETMLGGRVSGYEWASIIFLLILVVFTAHSMSDGTIVRAIFVTILATASVLLVLVLRDTNNLKWGKNDWTWAPLRRLFQNLDLIPYFPSNNLHEVKFEKGEKFRAGISPKDERNNSGDRKIKLIEYGAKKRNTT